MEYHKNKTSDEGKLRLMRWCAMCVLCVCVGTQYICVCITARVRGDNTDELEINNEVAQGLICDSKRAHQQRTLILLNAMPFDVDQVQLVWQGWEDCGERRDRTREPTQTGERGEGQYHSDTLTSAAAHTYKHTSNHTHTHALLQLTELFKHFTFKQEIVSTLLEDYYILESTLFIINWAKFLRITR